MMPDMTISAIPTMYKGIQFRSRLEARWAAFFDLQAMKWAYEPVELAGYIPDFVVDLVRNDDVTSTLVEVKPITSFLSGGDACRKIETSGWKKEALVVGIDPTVAIHGTVEVEDIDSDEATAGLTRFVLAGSRTWYVVQQDWNWWQGTKRATADWNEAGNLTQYKSPRKR